MPTPGRFRSKTTELSDFIRGSSSKHSSEAHLVPGPSQIPMPQVPTTPEKTTPTKTRRTLTFLTRRRKGSVSPSPSASSQKSGEPGSHGQSEDIPPLPEIPSRHTSESNPRSLDRLSSSLLSSSLPPVLPRPNVSPTSFGALTHFTSTKSDGTQTPDLEKPSVSPPVPPKTIRPQKSTSFESAANGALSSRSGRPVITVSPPRLGKEEKSPASSVSPKEDTRTVSSWKSPRSLRRPMILSFSHKKEEQNEKPLASPVSSTASATATPPLPPSMRFPIPPSSTVSTVSSRKSSVHEDTRSKRDTIGSSKSIRATSPTSDTFPEQSRRASRVPVQPVSEPKEPMDQLRPSSVLRSMEDTTPSRLPSRLSINTAGHSALARQGSLSSKQSSNTPTPTPSRLSFRRGSRSPSPAGTPPTAPLPSLPPEALDNPPPAASHRVSMPPSSIHSTPASSAASSPRLETVPTIPSMPSLSSSRSSVVPLRQQVLRPRANTIPTSPASPAAPPSLSSIPESGKLKDVDKPPETPPKDSFDRPSLSRTSSMSKSKEREREPPEDVYRRGSVSTTASTAASPPTTEYSMPSRNITDSPLYGDVMSLRATHEELIRSIRETHAMEKAELLRRIDQLEREARKREREIKGLRWLVMNANNAGGIGSEPAPSPSGSVAKTAVSLSAVETQGGRYRSSSKSSVLSQLSSAGSVNSSHRKDEAEGVLSALYSPRTSTEEGLYELQSTVSDLIVPATVTPPLTEAERSKAQSPSPAPPDTLARSSSSTSVPTRLRRANTLPDGVSQLPTPGKFAPVSIPTSKAARRTSSPVVPPNTPPSTAGTFSRLPAPTASGAGLGIHNIDLPSIPSTSSSQGFNRLSSTDTTLSVASTIPSLTSNVSTASSSALSAIPESTNPTPEPPEKDSTDDLALREEDREREVRRAMNRLSTSSTTANVGVSSSSNVNAASLAYHHNLKLDQTPSIASILDKSAEASMDDVLKKLRAFGGNGDH